MKTYLVYDNNKYEIVLNKTENKHLDKFGELLVDIYDEFRDFELTEDNISDFKLKEIRNEDNIIGFDVEVDNSKINNGNWVVLITDKDYPEDIFTMRFINKAEEEVIFECESFTDVLEEHKAIEKLIIALCQLNGVREGHSLSELKDAKDKRDAIKWMQDADKELRSMMKDIGKDVSVSASIVRVGPNDNLEDIIKQLEDDIRKDAESRGSKIVAFGGSMFSDFNKVREEANLRKKNQTAISEIEKQEGFTHLKKVIENDSSHTRFNLREYNRSYIVYNLEEDEDEDGYVIIRYDLSEPGFHTRSEIGIDEDGAGYDFTEEYLGGSENYQTVMGQLEKTYYDTFRICMEDVVLYKADKKDNEYIIDVWNEKEEIGDDKPLCRICLTHITEKDITYPSLVIKYGVLPIVEISGTKEYISFVIGKSTFDKLMEITDNFF